MFSNRADETKRLAAVADLMDRGQILQSIALLRQPGAAALGTAGEALLRDLDEKLASVDSLVAHMDAPQIWGKHHGKGMLLWHYTEGNMHHFKAEAILDVPPMDMLVILREWDLVPTWNGKNVPQAIVVEEQSLVSLRAASELYLPSPISNRSNIFDAWGYDFLERSGVLIIELRTTPESMAAMPQELQHMEAAYFREGTGIRLTPLTSQTAPVPGGKPVTADRCAFTYTLSLDPGSLHVPSWLVNVLITVIAPFVHSQLVKTVSSIKGEYAARRKQRQRLYGPLGKRCDALVARQAKEAAPVTVDVREAPRQRRGFFAAIRSCCGRSSQRGDSQKQSLTGVMPA